MPYTKGQCQWQVETVIFLTISQYIFCDVSKCLCSRSSISFHQCICSLSAQGNIPYVRALSLQWIDGEPPVMNTPAASTSSAIPWPPGTSIRRRRTHMIDRFHWRITANEATSWQERIPRKLTEGKGVPFATLLEPTPKTETSKRGFPKGGTTSGTPKRELTCQTRQNSSRGMLVAEKRSSFRDPWCPRIIGVALVHIAWCWYFEFTLPRCDMCGGKRYKGKQTPLFSTVNAAYSGVRLELSYTSSALCLSGTTISSVRIVFVCFHIARCCIQAYVLPRIRFMVFCLCLLLWGPCQCLRHLLIYSSLQPHPQRSTWWQNSLHVRFEGSCIQHFESGLGFR